jgi:hypothetical protein
MRKALVLLAGLVALALVDWTIAARERLVTEGRVVLLELAPVDPRSLMQGDYMALRFRIADVLTRDGAVPADGRLVVAVGPGDVATFRRLDDDSPLAPDEARLRYRIRDGMVTPLATATGSLSDMCSLTVSPSQGRWYFHYEGSGFAGGTSETLGFCPARTSTP